MPAARPVARALLHYTRKMSPLRPRPPVLWPAAVCAVALTAMLVATVVAIDTLPALGAAAADLLAAEAALDDDHYLAADSGGTVDHHVLFFGLDDEVAERLQRRRRAVPRQLAADVRAAPGRASGRSSPPAGCRTTRWVSAFAKPTASRWRSSASSTCGRGSWSSTSTASSAAALSAWAEAVNRDTAFGARKLRLEAEAAHRVRAGHACRGPNWLSTFGRPGSRAGARTRHLPVARRRHLADVAVAARPRCSRRRRRRSALGRARAGSGAGVQGRNRRSRDPLILTYVPTPQPTAAAGPVRFADAAAACRWSWPYHGPDHADGSHLEQASAYDWSRGVHGGAGALSWGGGRRSRAMNFVSWAFVALFLVVLAARLTIGRRKVESPYVGVLLVASLVFYSWHIPAYLAVLLVSATVDYVVAIAIHRLGPGQQALRRACLIASLAVNLGLLAFFKYGGFAVRAAEELAAARRGVAAPAGVLAGPADGDQFLHLPDDVVHHRRLPRARSCRCAASRRSCSSSASSRSWWPARSCAPASSCRRCRAGVACTPARSTRACGSSWSGFFLKMVCADNLAVYVDEYWERGDRDGADACFALWLALMFSGQIFADFAGYSTHRARARLPARATASRINFNAPYLAGSFKNFWERWHITLSSWLRDYLYVPLGGNRGSRLRTLREPDAGDAARRPVARRGLHLHRVGGHSRAVPGGGARARLAAADVPRGRSPCARAWFVVVQGVVLVAWMFFRSATVGRRHRLRRQPRRRRTGGRPDAWMVRRSCSCCRSSLLHGYTWLVERGRVAELGADGTGACSPRSWSTASSRSTAARATSSTSSSELAPPRQPRPDRPSPATLRAVPRVTSRAGERHTERVARARHH